MATEEPRWAVTTLDVGGERVYFLPLWLGRILDFVTGR